MEPATASEVVRPSNPISVTPGAASVATEVSFGASVGEYRYATDQASADDAIAWMLDRAEPSLLTRAMAVGVDIETTSLKPTDGRIRLCQLAAGNRAVVLDAFAFDPWPLMRSALIGLGPDWIAHNAEFEQSWFSRHTGFTLLPMFDTRLIYMRERARRGGDAASGSNSLQAVCADLLGFELSKAQRLSDWTKPHLTSAQVEYAALDALVLPVLRKRMERDALDAGWTSEIEAATEQSRLLAERIS